jgi:hypothetical protein
LPAASSNPAASKNRPAGSGDAAAVPAIPPERWIGRMKLFREITGERDHHASWCLTQAATFLVEAKARRSSSLLIYAALELRLAVEQLIFTLILVAKGKADKATLRACQRKGGLLRMVEEVAPQYALKCKFARVLATIHPQIPQSAKWDIRELRRLYAALSEVCHAQLVIRGMGPAPELWNERLALLEEAHAFITAGLRKDTAALTFKGATPQAMQLWKRYALGKISLAQVRQRLAADQRRRGREPAPS